MLLKGIITHAKKPKNILNNGASKNKSGFALLGIVISLITNFKPSAMACNRPQNPTTLGPVRRCIKAINFRSAKV